MRPPARVSTLSAFSIAVLLAGTSMTAPVASAVGIAADSGTCPVAAGSYAGGTGSVGDPLLIQTPEQLQRLRDTTADWSKNVRLTADIDMGGCVWGSTIGGGLSTWTAGFDGDGHVVSGLDIDITAPGGDTGIYAGFIAYLGAGSSVTDLGFTGDVTATLVGTESVIAYAGGLVGFTLGRPITGSFATGDVTVNVTVTPSGQGVFSPDDADATVQAGGLVGVLQGSVSNSYATGNVHATVTATATGTGRAAAVVELGGLVGWSPSAISNSYATGAVTSTLSATGGSTQNVSDGRGGFLGWYSGNTLSGNAWNTTSSGLANAAANGPHAGVTGFPTSAMQSVNTFDGNGLNWSITHGYSPATVWSMCSGFASGLPFLSAFHAASPCPPPPPPTPASAPLDVSALPGDGTAVVAWTPPASSGSFAITNYQASAIGANASCLATAPATTCTVRGLTDGQPYAFRVRALTGAGWGAWSEASNAVTPQPPVRPGIIISGTRGEVRGKPGIVITGQVTGVGMGAIVTPWVRVAGASEFTEGSARILVSEQGEFTWQRRASGTVRVYVQTPDGSLRSNTLILRR